MDSQRERIQDDLRGCVEGSVECDNPTTLLYSTDGSIHQMRPMAVVCPRHWRDVAQVINYSRDHGLCVHSRGAGSSLAGESLGEGVILDFSRFMRRIFQFQGDLIRVQPGVVRERLNAGMRSFGLCFGPDGGNHAASTIGGQIALNSAGSNWLKYGAAGGRLVSLKAVLADGTPIQFDENSALSAPADSVLFNLNKRLEAIYRKNAALIDAMPRNSSIHHAGYNLNALRDGKIDYMRLLAGSEGTLAVFTELTLQLQSIPRYRSAVLFFFDSIKKAALGAKEAIHLQIDSCDLMDRRHLHLASENDPRIDLLVPHEAEAALLIFCSGESAVGLHNRLRILNENLCLNRGLAFAENITYDDDEVKIFTKIRDSIQPMQPDMGFVRPVSYVDDVTVDPQRLDEFMAELLVLMQTEGIRSSIYCHAPQGQMHLHPLMNLHKQEERARLEEFACKYYELAWKFGGYLGREHGTGLSRAAFLKRQSPEYYEIYRAIKETFDPEWILQPGKIIVPDMPRSFINLRKDLSIPETELIAAEPDKAEITPENPPAALEDLTVLQMDWRQDRILKDCFVCSDCGSCRDQSSEHRACPIFRQDWLESMSPRAKANLVRSFAIKQLELEELLSDEVKKILDGCINCRSCQYECPVHAPAPQMILQARGAYVSAMGLSFSDRLLGQFDRLSRWAIRLRPLAAGIIQSPLCRKILEKTLGLSAARKMPPIPRKAFLNEYAEFARIKDSSGVAEKRTKVFLFVSAFANFHDTSLARAAIQVLEHNGIEVVCNVNQKPSGLTALTMGMMDEAAALARHNVNIMADAIRDGCDIVCMEPADVYCIKNEYPMLLEQDSDAMQVAKNISDLGQYLWKAHQRSKLNLQFQPINITLGYHAPCRLRALDIGYPSVNLMRLIPELNVNVLESGCCGMAGMYGMQSKNYYNSVRIGMPLMTKLRNPTIQASATECSSCRFAMEHRTTKSCVHPIKIMACAYGLMPEIVDLLRRPVKDTFLS